eukprot:gb/GEZN01001552.1/.p1 GENE.gb/GEZN01001552.1/~~gb/GEZN01001552.1/.p1  ORF type:complete len:811 (+),score=114.51 gb/GEZN01001552.1/:291-2435(+)
MMIFMNHLKAAGFFEIFLEVLYRRNPTPTALLMRISVCSAILASLLTNDGAAIFMSRVVIVVCQEKQLPLVPFLLAVATNCNLGSAFFLSGNPQNVLVKHLAGDDLSFLQYFLLAALPTLAALGINNLMLCFCYRNVGKIWGPILDLVPPLPNHEPIEALEPRPEGVTTQEVGVHALANTGVNTTLLPASTDETSSSAYLSNDRTPTTPSSKSTLPLSSHSHSLSLPLNSPGGGHTEENATSSLSSSHEHLMSLEDHAESAKPEHLSPLEDHAESAKHEHLMPLEDHAENAKQGTSSEGLEGMEKTPFTVALVTAETGDVPVVPEDFHTPFGPKPRSKKQRIRSTIPPSNKSQQLTPGASVDRSEQVAIGLISVHEASLSAVSSQEQSDDSSQQGENPLNTETIALVGDNTVLSVTQQADDGPLSGTQQTDGGVLSEDAFVTYHLPHFMPPLLPTQSSIATSASPLRPISFKFQQAKAYFLRKRQDKKTGRPLRDGLSKRFRIYQVVVLLTIAVMLTAFLVGPAGVELGWTCVAFALIVTMIYSLLMKMEIDSCEILNVEAEVLLVFIGIFVVSAGVVDTGYPKALWELIFDPADEFNPYNIRDLSCFTGLLAFLGNAIGNVAVVLLFADGIGNSPYPTISWALTAWIATVVGNLTLLGSAANLIVATSVSSKWPSALQLTFTAYAKFATLTCIITLLVGVVIMYLEGYYILDA